MAQKKLKSKKELALMANTVRQDLLKALHKAGSGHPGGSLGMADVFTALYFSEMKNDPKKPEWDKRDRLVLSNGHICPVLYAVMARQGYFPVEELQTLREEGSRLQGHPHRAELPGIETSSGPLGSGLSQACGMALAARMNKQKHTVFCMTSDGEHEEGNTWEAVMLAGKEKLGNLVQIMDRNYIQIDGNTEDVMPLDPVKEKYESFGWVVYEVGGHTYNEILSAIRKAKNQTKKPALIVAYTVPGKGVSYMEHDHNWHGKTTNDEEFEQAMSELETIREKIVKNTYAY